MFCPDCSKICHDGGLRKAAGLRSIREKAGGLRKAERKAEREPCAIWRADKKGHPPLLPERQVPSTPIIFRTKKVEKSSPQENIIFRTENTEKSQPQRTG